MTRETRRGLPETAVDDTMTEKEIRLPETLDVETATDVLREFAQTDEAQIVSESAIESLRSEITEAKEAFAAVLAEESPQSADTLSRQDMDALTEPFRGDDGDIDVDTLRQVPETQDGGDTDTEPDDGSRSVDTLSLDEREEIARKRRKANSMRNRSMDGRASAIEAEIADTLEAESFDDIEAELEAL